MIGNPKVQRWLAIGIIVLFLGAGITQSTAQRRERPILPLLNGDWLYVGGSGPDNYTRIQDAVNNASDGDTVFVYKGTYVGYVVIAKSIRLIGEDKNTTIISGYFAYTVYILSDYVNISGFTIYTNGRFGEGFRIDSRYNHIFNNIIDAPRDRIRVAGDSNMISGNTIKNCYFFISSDNNTISGNTIINTYFGICLTGYARDNIIFDNALYNSGVFISEVTVGNNIVTNNTVNNKPLLYLHEASGLVIEGGAGQIILFNCTNITVHDQEIYNTTVGIQLWGTKSCTISSSTITGNHYGIYISGWNNTISNNTFTHNYYGTFLSGGNNTLSGNLFSNNNGNGIYASYSIHNHLVKNTIRNNNHSILLDYGSDFNTILNNTITNNSDPLRLYGNSNTIAGNTITHNTEEGINIAFSDHNSIHNNTITYNTGDGIYLGNSDENTVMHNIITHNDNDGIRLFGNKNTLSANTLSMNTNGILVLHHNDNIITGNQIAWNTWSGVYLNCSNDNTITGNNFSKNRQGVCLISSTNNTVLSNNFLRNKRQALFENCTNTWDQNYWGRPRFLPKLLVGIQRIQNTWSLPLINIDWHPAQAPFEVP
jgi:parallel beta-helix repeat protein